jgi:transposase
VLDNASSHKTPTIRRWLAQHPRFHLHFTPTSSSWINLVERWFGELTTKLLRRGAHRSVCALNTDIRQWIETWNENPRPYVWTRSPDRMHNRLLHRRTADRWRTTRLGAVRVRLGRVVSAELAAPERAWETVAQVTRGWAGGAPRGARRRAVTRRT